MPADRSLADGVGDELVGHYQTLRTAVASALAAILRRSLTSGLLGGEARRAALRLIQALDSRLPTLAREAMVEAYERGRREADREVNQLRRKLIQSPTRIEVTGRVVELAQALRATHPRVLAWAEQAYREVVMASLDATPGTRLQQSQRVWGQLLDKGITGYTDVSGRRWELGSYVEMATRSRLADTAVTAHLDRLAAAGLDLVIVSDVAGECALCRPFEGRVLARAGASGSVRVRHATEDRLITVSVAATVAEAHAAGLQHPSCRHSLSAYLPGVTKASRHTEDPAGDAARQRQRAIERQIRSWKLRADTALDPAAGREAAARVRLWQAKLREHLAAHPDLRRLPQRERIGVAR